MVIVASLDRAQDAFARFRPTVIVSILDAGDPDPTFPELAPERCLTFRVKSDDDAEALRAAARERAEKLIALVNQWNGDGDILVHCHQGVARSMAAAFIIQCMKAPSRPEAEIAAELRKIAPHADPCLYLICAADDLLGRGGRMVEAIEDLRPACATLAAPIVVLPLAA